MPSYGPKIGNRGLPTKLAVGLTLLLAPVAGPLGTAAAASSGRVSSGAAGTAHVMCFEEQPVARVRPSQCPIFGEPEDEADLIRLSGAHWTGWGTPTARATGIALGNKPEEEEPVPVTITLSRLRRVCDGQLFYTRLLAVKRSGTSDWFNSANQRELRLSGACRSIPFG
jgi:hypothetical protein